MDFTFQTNYARIVKAVKGSFLVPLSQLECVCSSVDRAMPSGGMCGGSTPLRRLELSPECTVNTAFAGLFGDFIF